MANTAEQEEELRRHVSPAFVDAFDREFAATFGRYPTESPLFGTRPENTARRQAIQNLVEQGATEGERAAARAALLRLDAEPDDDAARLAQDLQDEADYEEALAFGEA